jgi:hypothetical protein
MAAIQLFLRLVVMDDVASRPPTLGNQWLGLLQKYRIERSAARLVRSVTVIVLSAKNSSGTLHT